VSTEAEPRDIVSASAFLAGKAASALSAAVGASILAYATGWYYASSYFLHANAQWVLAWLGPQQLIALSWLPMLSLLSVSLMFSVAVAADFRGKPFVVPLKQQLWLSGVSVLVFIAALVAQGYRRYPLASSLWHAAAGLSAVLAAAAILDVVNYARHEEKKRRHFAAMNIIVICSLVPVIIHGLASSTANVDFDPLSSRLPFATDNAGREYRLVLVAENLGLVASLAPQPERTEFRFVPLESLRSIRHNCDVSPNPSLQRTPPGHSPGRCR